MRVLFKELEVLARELLNFVRERIEPLPELRRRPMHLQVSQRSLLLCCFDFLPQEIELARGGVPLDLPIPILPVSFGNPLPQPSKVFTGKGFNFGLNGFNLGHRSLRPGTVPILRSSSEQNGDRPPSHRF